MMIISENLNYKARTKNIFLHSSAPSALTSIKLKSKSQPKFLFEFL